MAADGLVVVRGGALVLLILTLLNNLTGNGVVFFLLEVVLGAYPLSVLDKLF